MGEEKLEILEVTAGERLDRVRDLFKEYTDWLGFDLAFQDFDKEFAELPGDYVPPFGRLLLALWDGEPAGCGALRKITEEVCEGKRLYVRSEFRRKWIGRKLSLVLIEEARKIGYRYVRLDTVPWMTEAIALYRSMGFKEIEPYRYNPIEGSTFMELELR